MARVLIVEDEVIIADDIKTSLETLGYESPLTVDSGEAAVALSAEQKPDAVLMDIRLRDTMDGIEAAKIIQHENQIPVIFITAYTDDMLIKRAKAANPFGYLVKPVDDRELKAMLEMALQKAHTEKERAREEHKDSLARKHESLLTFAGGIAHNFNNILTSVMGSIDLAMHDRDSDKFLKTARQQAARATELCRDIFTCMGECPSPSG